MLTIIDKPGQLCNRLWSFVPFVAYTLHFRVKLNILYFDRYRLLFEDLEAFNQVNFSTLPESTASAAEAAYGAINQFPRWTRQALKLHTFSPTDGSYAEMERGARSGLVLVKSWTAPVPTHYLLTEHDGLRKLFAPKQIHTTKVEATFAIQRQRCDLIVGVHIRRGDYRDYLGGKYYYEDAIYLRHMQELQRQLPGRRVIFFLCSNEPLAPTSFASVEHFTLPDAEGIEDLYGLSCCDYLLGPPSTYSMWASFYGSVPLWFINRPDDTLTLESFSVIVSQNTFANGEVWRGDL